MTILKVPGLTLEHNLISQNLILWSCIHLRHDDQRFCYFLRENLDRELLLLERKLRLLSVFISENLEMFRQDSRCLPPCNDRNLFLLHFDSGSESLLYHLSELKGMASWKQKYEPLGLDAAGIEGKFIVP